LLRKNGLRYYGTTNQPLCARPKYETLHDIAIQKIKKQVPRQSLILKRMFDRIRPKRTAYI